MADLLEIDIPFWGKPTATIDWCEENYDVTEFVAEFINTTTNLMFVALCIFGVYNVIRNGTEKRFIISHMGMAFVGIGSWFFHMTLLYEMQLLDELPMIYGSCLLVWNIFETHPQLKYGYKLPLGLLGYSVFVTVAYLYYIHDPVFHQVCYGLLVFTIVFRSSYLVRQLPKSEARSILVFVLRTAAASFLGAFVLWNIDNIFCKSLRGWRQNIGFYPVGALSELHGWWHIGTALGCYYYVVFNEWIQQILVGNPDVFELRYALGFVPYIRKVEGTVKSHVNGNGTANAKKEN